jgi:hypothetical protein
MPEEIKLGAHESATTAGEQSSKSSLAYAFMSVSVLLEV